MGSLKEDLRLIFDEAFTNKHKISNDGILKFEFDT